MDHTKEASVAGKLRSIKKDGFRHLSDPSSERIREQLEQFISMQGRRPRVLMARLEGQKRDHLLKLAANGFGDLGFDVDLSPEGLTPVRVAEMTVENDVHVICLTNIKKNDAHLFGTIQAKLRKVRSENVSIIGIGDVSPSDRDHLIQAGFADIFIWGPTISKSVGRLLDRLRSANFDPERTGACIEGVLARDRPMIAKTISLIESRAAKHRAMAQRILDSLYPHTGNAVRIGVTGIPGAGKSTFIESFGMQLLEMGHRVAVLAIDPSSSISGGSLLGDKTRMARLSADSRAFIRPSPSRGILGGVAGKTRETMLVCEAAGFDVILVETVGVGQTEIEVACMVDFFLLLLVAGAGDQYQGIKKGISELADAIVITKADGDNIHNAAAAREEYAKALSLLRPKSPLWRPPVVTCSAHDPESIEEIWGIISQYVERLSNAGELKKKRARQSVDWMLAMVDQGLMNQFRENPRVVRTLNDVLQSIEGGNLSPEEAARQLLEAYDTPIV
jgi:LAO/AO transport system kinase